jgi:hypothetical protein
MFWEDSVNPFRTSIGVAVPEPGSLMLGFTRGLVMCGDVESAHNLLIEIQSFKDVLNIKKEDSFIHLR